MNPTQLTRCCADIIRPLEARKNQSTRTRPTVALIITAFAFPAHSQWSTRASWAECFRVRGREMSSLQKSSGRPHPDPLPRGEGTGAWALRYTCARGGGSGEVGEVNRTRIIKLAIVCWLAVIACQIGIGLTQGWNRRVLHSIVIHLAVGVVVFITLRQPRQ